MNHEPLPRERLNIVCKTGDDEPEMELPMRLLFVGDYMGREERAVEDRIPVRIDRGNFGAVLAAHSPRLELVVPSGRSSEEGSAVRASLTFRQLSDFGPDAIAQQIPEVAALLALRQALTTLKNTGDVASFRARLEELALSGPARERLLAALGLAGG